MQTNIINAAIAVQLVLTQAEYDEQIAKLNGFAEKYSLAEPEVFEEESKATRKNVKTGEVVEIAGAKTTVTYTVQMHLTSIQQYNVLLNKGVEKKQARIGRPNDYTPEQRQAAVDLYNSSDSITYDDVAEKFGMSKGSIMSWVKKDKERKAQAE